MDNLLQYDYNIPTKQFTKYIHEAQFELLKLIGFILLALTLLTSMYYIIMNAVKLKYLEKRVEGIECVKVV